MHTLKEIYDSIFVNSLAPVEFSTGWKAYTDKNLVHRYVDNLYEDLFKDIRFSTKKVLEIGIYGGGSMLLWQKYFENATIYGVDKLFCIKEFIEQERMVQIIGDAYSDDIANMLPSNEFDIVIDDGPHTVESFKLFIEKYWSKVKPGGYFIIEDIYDNVAQELIGHLPEEYRTRAKIYDFRPVTNLFDDVILVVKK